MSFSFFLQPCFSKNILDTLKIEKVTYTVPNALNQYFFFGQCHYLNEYRLDQWCQQHMPNPPRTICIPFFPPLTKDIIGACAKNAEKLMGGGWEKAVSHSKSVLSSFWQMLVILQKSGCGEI